MREQAAKVATQSHLGYLLEPLFELWWPLLHQHLDVRHTLGVLYLRGWLRSMQIVDRVDPLCDLFRLLVRVLNRHNAHRVEVRHLDQRPPDQVEHCVHTTCVSRMAATARLHADNITSWVGLLSGRLIQHLEPEVVRLAVWPRHLDERVDLSNSGDVVRNEALYLRVQLNVVWLVAPNVPEQFAYLSGHIEVCVVRGVVPSEQACRHVRSGATWYTAASHNIPTLGSLVGASASTRLAVLFIVVFRRALTVVVSRACCEQHVSKAGALLNPTKSSYTLGAIC